ncbi:hypothetical protein RA2_03432 [Roseovarius sp. A-2]|uniref:hypothetical protein n=1 Tax=Roseovarius sp. A-2 TaxID=1570360 RepID=UPI0009B50D15|nr:hypothetical protein [Roseovarius sp. A-2]GAW36362.1 hypothetical protein RA2_03432 [Roseovarius sp. A-2]
MTKEQSTIHAGIGVSKDKLAVAITGGGVRDEVLSLYQRPYKLTVFEYSKSLIPSPIWLSYTIVPRNLLLFQANQAVTTRRP